MQIEMKPAESRSSVVITEGEPAWLAKNLADLDRGQAKAAQQPNVDRLKLIGALEQDFEL